jgi:hypothetical protein
VANTVTWGAQTFHPVTTMTHGKVLLLDQDWGDAPVQIKTQPAAYGWGSIELSVSLPETRTGGFVLLCQCGTEAKAWSMLDAIKALIRPSLAPVTLTNAFANQAGAVSRYLKVRTTRCPAMSWLDGSPPTFVGKESAGNIKLPVIWQTVECPLFRSTTAATDTVALSTAKQTKTIVNAGEWPIGLRLDLSDIVGTWTSILITNTTAGPNGESGGVLVWSDAALANADYLDWRYTNLKWPVWTAGNAVLAATAYIILWPGSNSIEFTGVGGTSGTITATWREMWF